MCAHERNMDDCVFVRVLLSHVLIKRVDRVMSELCATGEWGWCNVCPTEVHSVWARGPTSSACLHPSALQSALQSGTSADVREDCWMTNEQTYIDLDTHTHARSRKKTNRHIVHSYSYGHTHTHSILLLFTLFLLYIHVTHMKLRHTSMHFKRNAIFFSLHVFLSQPIQNTYTHTWNTHLLSDLLECHSIFITAIPSDLLLTSELWLM